MKWIYVPILTLSLLLSGCWDQTNIGDQAFILGVGVDLVPPSEEDPTAIYRLTYEIPLVSLLAAGAQGQAEENQRASRIMTTVASSQAEALYQLSTRISRRPFLGHLQVLVIGEETARQGIDALMDFWGRFHELPRGIVPIVAQGEAMDVFSINPPLERTVSNHLFQITGLEFRRSGRFPRYTLPQALSHLLETGAVILPRVTQTNDEAKVAGSAVFRDWKMVGWLGEVETRGALWLLDRMITDNVMTLEPEESPQGKVAVTIHRTNTHVWVRDTYPLPTFHFQIIVSGSIAGRSDFHSPMTQMTIIEIEDSIGKSIQSEAFGALVKYREFQSDFLQLKTILRTRYPRIWQQVEARWEESFAQVPVEVSTSVHIRLLGMVV